MSGRISEDSPLPALRHDDLVAVVRPSVVANYANKVADFFPTRVADVRKYGLSTSNSAGTNQDALQSAIQAMYAVGGGLLVVGEPYYCDPVILLENVHLSCLGGPRLRGPTPEGAASPGAGALPGGGAFLITDTSESFLRVAGHNNVSGLTCYYPEQNYAVFANRVNYPPTIAPNGAGILNSVTLHGCAFVGSTSCIDFSAATAGVQDFAIDLCYGYPIGGDFLRIVGCYDIPRISRCHVHPATGHPFLAGNGNANSLPYSEDIIRSNMDPANDVVAFRFSNVDQLDVAHCFALGVYVGFEAADCYGSLVACSVDTCPIGVLVDIKAAVASLQGGYRALSIGHLTNQMAQRSGSAYTFYGLVYVGDGGALKVSDSHFVANELTAISAIEVAGSSTQRVFVSNTTSTEVAGSGGGWINNGVRSTNGAAVVTGAVSHYS